VKFPTGGRAFLRRDVATALSPRPGAAQAATVDPREGSRRSQSGWEKERRAAAPRAASPSFVVPTLPVEAGTPPEDESLDAISVENISKSFVVDKRSLPVLDHVSFEVPAHGISAVLGPNGSGKSTLLRLISGLIEPAEGRILIDGEAVAGADPRVGLVFQEPRLLPWRTAIDNVSFPLELSGVDSTVRRERARSLLELVGVGAFADAYPHQLSGGMRQRVAIARALVREPQILLLDEPFSALDALTRERFNVELLELWQRTGTAIILVTHSIPEAVFVADEIVVLSASPGRVLARVPVPLGRPRRAEVLDSQAFGATAAAVRAHLSGTPAELAQQEAAGAPARDVLDRAGAPAFFDPWRNAS